MTLSTSSHLEDTPRLIGRGESTISADGGESAIDGLAKRREPDFDLGAANIAHAWDHC